MHHPAWRCSCGTHNEDIPEAERCWKCHTVRRKRDAVEVLFDGVERCVNRHEPRPIGSRSCSFCFPTSHPPSP